MTTLCQALDGIRIELAAKLKAMTPNRKIESTAARFREHNRTPGVELADATPSARQFEIGDADPDAITFYGKAVQIQSHTITITIAYPDDFKWHIAAMDDFSKLKRTLFSTHGSHGVGGVNYRVISPDAQPIVSPQGGEKPINFYTIPVTVVTETTEA